MKKFLRPPESSFIKGTVIRKRPVYSKELRNILSELTLRHCSYCDTLLNFDGEIDQFLPKSKYPDLQDDWNNLYICCSVCNGIKADKYDDKLLRPDAEDYSFDRYFVCNVKTGEILPNVAASIEDIDRAKITIEIFDLNSDSRIRARRLEYERFSMLLYTLKSNAELKKESFDVTKYGDLLDTNKYSYRFFLERLLYDTDNHKQSTTVYDVERNDNELEKLKIKSLTIHNIKGFSDLKINFNSQNSTNLILGINGRGKTTIIQLLAIALQQLDRRVLNKKWNDVVKKGCTEGYFIVQFENYNNLTLHITINDNDEIIFVSGYEEYQKIKDNILVLGYGSHRQSLERYEDEKDSYQCVSSLFGDNYLKSIRMPGVSNYLRNNFSYIQALINKIFKYAEDENQVLLDRYDDYNFYFKTPTNKSISIPFEALAEGYKAVFVWLIDMIIRVVERGYTIFSTEKIYGIILIDEIDLHLHPTWQRSLMPILTEIFPNVQFIISSHSPFVIQSLSISEAIILVLHKNEIKTKKLKQDGTFNAYKIDDVIESILGAETENLKINDWLANKLDLLEKAVLSNNRLDIATLSKELKSKLPQNSGFRDSIDILTAGLIK